MEIRQRRAAEVAATVAAVVWGVLFARYVLATSFASYDDEGYFLVALGRYFALGPATAGSYTHYGPFYYFVQSMLVTQPVTHDAGRVATLLCWVASGVLAGVFAWRVSSSVVMGGAAMLAVVRVLSVLAQEPGHPQQVIAVLLALGVSLCVNAGQWRLVAMGAVGAALAFTKINVGGFYLAALAHAAVCLLPRGRWRSAGLAVLIAYAVMAAPLLARAHLSSGAAGFVAVASLCAWATFAWGLVGRADSVWGGREIAAVVGGAAACALSVVVVTLAQGVSLGALVDGIVLMPARNPAGGLFLSFRLGWVECSATVIVLCAMWWVGRRGLPGLVRAGAGVAAIFLLVRTDLTWVMPLLPLGVMPLTGQQWSAGEWFTRLFVADLAATQFLQTYPVAGGQAGIAAVPVMLWAFLCVSDGMSDIGRSRQTVLVGAFVAVVVASGMWVSGFRGPGFAHPASRLPGATSLHLPPGQEATFEYLAGAIRKNCSVLFALPRQGSLNLWSGVGTVEGSESALSFQVMPGPAQAAVLERLQSDSRACAVYNRELLDFWQAPAGVIEGSELAKFVIREMPVAAERDGYQLKVSPTRVATWIP